MNTTTLLQELTFKPPINPPHNFCCECLMCKTYESNKISRQLRMKNSHVMDRLQQRLKGIATPNNQNQFLWIIKRLLLPSNKIVTRGIEIYVPQICFYQNGEPICFYMTKQISDYTLKEIGKDRLGNTFLQKTFNQRRRKYRQRIMSLTKPIVQQRKKTVNANKEQNKIDMKDAVVVKYVDGFQQLMSEQDFGKLMANRRQDTIWSRIESIKNYFPVKDQLKDCLVIKYNSGSQIDTQLFQRAKTLMRVYSTNIRSDEAKYISEQNETIFTTDLRESNLKKLFQYLVYKIVNFVHFFYDTKITKAKFQWIIDQLKHPILVNLFKLEYQAQISYDWTNDVIDQKVRESQNKVFYDKKIRALSESESIVSERIQRIMDGQYQRMKQYYGLSLKVEENSQQAQNNAFFRKIHPQCKVDISTLLTKDLTVQNFKRIYLGWKKQKQPIVTEFKSGMLRILHNLTPRTSFYKNVKRPSTVLTDKPKTSTSLKRNTSTRHNSRNNSTRGSFNRTVVKFTDVNKSVNLYDF